MTGPSEPTVPGGPVPAGRTPARDAAPLLNQVNLVVEDMRAAVAFYRRLGLDIDAEPGSAHVELHMPNGMCLELDTAASVGLWDSGWVGGRGGGAVLGFAVPTREAVDRLYAEVTEAGAGGHQRPFDAFWGSRYAIVEDPDGHCVGLMSPIDESLRSWPPHPPPVDP